MSRPCSALVLFVRSHLESVLVSLARHAHWDFAGIARQRECALALRARWCAIETLQVKETGAALETVLLEKLGGRHDKVNALVNALRDAESFSALEARLDQERLDARLRLDALVESLASLGQACDRLGGRDGNAPT